MEDFIREVEIMRTLDHPHIVGLYGAWKTSEIFVRPPAEYLLYVPHMLQHCHAFAGLLLAVTGIYGVVAFSVALRAQEIAIRMALGEQRVGIVRLVLTAAAKMALLGCGLGLLGSIAASRVISSFLFEVSGTDPLIYGAAVALMIVMTLLASLLPASRAAAADPNTVLRAA